MRKALKNLLLTAALCAGTAPAALASDKTYVYKHSDGTVWHTNKHPSTVSKDEYQLIGVINMPRSKKSKRRRAAKAKKQAPMVSCGSAGDGRAAKYVPLIDRLAKEYAISKHLIMAIVATESCFDEKAVSAAGARGLMQLMPMTAKELGVTNPFDHEQNLRGGVEYLGRLSKRFNYNPKLTLAAYNAGPGNVLKYRGIPPFPETQAYVEKVMNKFHHYMKQAAG